jgi:Bles03-like protein
MTIRPSSFNQHPWIYAEDPKRIGREGNPESLGKWLVFVGEDEVDAVWEKVASATSRGQLGLAAKVATAWPNPLARSSKRVICVYTYDFNDQEDVTRVLVALRGLGFRERLSYKTDIDTLAGRYGSGAATYVSQPDQLTFEIRRSTERSHDRDTR